MNYHFNEGGRLRAERPVQRFIELACVADAPAFQPLGVRELAKIEVRELGPDRSLNTKKSAKVFQRLVAAVVHDHEANRDVELRRAPQALDGVHARAVTKHCNG